MPFLYGGSNAGAIGQGGAPVTSFSLQNSFNADVALGDIPGVRSFIKQSVDTHTSQVNPPRFIIDIDMAERTDLTANTTLYISSSSASDVGQVVIVDGISIVDIGGTNKLKEVFGFAVTNGLTQVEVTELGTGSPLGFFRINTFANLSSPFVSFLGDVYLAQLDTGGSPALGIPSLANTQDVISLAIDFTASPTSHGFSQSGSYTIPQVLVTGETVRGMTITNITILPDSTLHLFSKVRTFNGSGAIIRDVIISSYQTGLQGGNTVHIENLFLIEPGTEVKLYSRLGSNNQTLVVVIAGMLYFTPT